MFQRVIWSVLLLLAGVVFSPADASAEKLKVVTTSADYAYVVGYIGGDFVTVSNIIQGNQDPHQVRPKPSFAQLLAEADILVATGLDLEMWLPSLIDKSGNSRIREGQRGYVAVHYGVDKLEIPTSYDRSAGDVHVFGNPHFHTNPLTMKLVARNIAIGLIKNDSAHESFYKAQVRKFQDEIDERMFGKELVALIGSKTLTKLARKGNLISFLEKKKFKGKLLIEHLGGWMKKALPLRGVKLVSFHKNWTYFAQVFGLDFVGEVEPKPGIPPSAQDVANLVDLMNRDQVKVIFAANYFDENKIRRICQKVSASAVVVPLSVSGEPGVNTYFDLVDLWLNRLLEATGK